MFESWFASKKKIATPLLDVCRKANERTLQAYVEQTPRDDPQKKGTALWMLSLMGTASLVDGLKWERGAAWPSSKQHWAKTNLDTVAAEGLVFLECYFARRFLRSATTDRPTFERIGHDAMGRAAHLAMGTVGSRTGIDYAVQGKATRDVYVPAIRDGVDLVALLTARILACSGRQSLADPPRATEGIPDLVSVPLSMTVGVYFATMPSAYWDTYVALLREMPERFPPVEGED